MQRKPKPTLQDKAEDNPELEAAMGFPLFNDGPPEGKLGWLLNVNATLVDDRDAGRAVAAVNCYFQCQDGSGFKAQVPFAPYFYVVTRPGAEGNVEGYLRRKHGAAVRDVSAVSMEDLDLKNHLAGIRRRLLKVTFWTTQGLGEVRRDLLPAARKAKARDAREGVDSGGVGVGGPSLFGGGSSAAGGNAGGAQDDDCADIEDDDDDDGGPSTSARGFGGYSRGGGRGGAGSGRPDARARVADALSSVLDVREHDVPYATRFLIDTGARCGHWFRVRARGGVTTMERRADLIARADVRVCAFDIETTKLPLQFPNAEFDQIFMISYMVDGQGYLITNREVVSADCADFEYSPKPEFQGPFTVFNERDEAALLRKFFSHVRELKPAVFVTYNGDWFDFPFIANRARFHGLSIEEEIGFKPPAAKVDFGGGFGGNDAEPAAVASMDPSSPLYGPGEWLSRTAVHLDCLHW
jgi:DNA polymerase epsilon subunit 1